MTLKDLAICIWAAARIKMPKDSELPVLLNIKANDLLLENIEAKFNFNWD